MIEIYQSYINLCIFAIIVLVFTIAMLWCAWILTFFFSFIYFSWFNIFFFWFFFFFTFIFVDDEEACDGNTANDLGDFDGMGDAI